jgi:large subunit ribosomal protein L21
MYAVIQTGGKQYRLSAGDTVRVETLDAEEGASVEFDNILMVADGDNIKLGTPYIDGGKVVAKVKAHGRHKKIEIIKFNRRKHYDKRTGHRQNYTELEITDIQAG